MELQLVQANLVGIKSESICNCPVPSYQNKTDQIISCQTDELLKFLNGMEIMITGNEYVDDGFHNDLVQCLEKTDVNLYQSINSQWSGIKQYANSGGSGPDDIWYPCDTQDQKPDQVW